MTQKPRGDGGGTPGRSRGAREPFGILVRRAVRRRCVACGNAPLFRTWLRIEPVCTACGYVPEREAGYWLGAVYVDYAVAGAVCLAGHLVLADHYGLSAAVQSAILLPLAVVVVWASFPYAKALWLALDLACDPPRRDEFVDASGTAPARRGFFGHGEEQGVSGAPFRYDGGRPSGRSGPSRGKP